MSDFDATETDATRTNAALIRGGYDAFAHCLSERTLSTPIVLNEAVVRRHLRMVDLCPAVEKALIDLSASPMGLLTSIPIVHHKSFPFFGLRNLGKLWYREHDGDRVGTISDEKICRAATYLKHWVETGAESRAAHPKRLGRDSH